MLSERGLSPEHCLEILPSEGWLLINRLLIKENCFSIKHEQN